MKNIYVTIYTKEQGRIDLTKEEYVNLNLDTVTFHRTDSPVMIYYYEDGNVCSEYYYINDKIHRLDGPAAIWYYKNGIIENECYFINGIYYNKKDYDILINEMKALPKSLRLIHELWWVREL